MGPIGSFLTVSSVHSENFRRPFKRDTENRPMIHTGSNNVGIHDLQMGQAGLKGSAWADAGVACTGQAA